MSENNTEELIKHLNNTKVHTIKTFRALKAVTKNYCNHIDDEKTIEKDSIEEKELYKLFLMLIDRESSIELRVRIEYNEQLKEEIEKSTGWVFSDDEIRYKKNPDETYVVFFKRSGYYVPKLEKDQQCDEHLKRIYDKSEEFININKSTLWLIGNSINEINDIMNGKYELSEFSKRLKDPELPILIAKRLGFPGVPQKYTFKETSSLMRTKKK